MSINIHYIEKKIRERIQKSEFLKHFLMLFSGSLTAHLIPIIIIPVLTRLFSAEIFGIYFVYSAMVMVLSTLSTMQYELAIVLPQEDDEALVLLLISFIMAILISSLTALLIFIFYDLVTSILGEKAVGYWIYLLPVSIFLVGTAQALGYWANRQKDYSTMSKGRIMKAVGTSAVQFGTGISQMQPLGLIPGLILGQFTAAAYFVFNFRNIIRKAFQHLSLKKILHVAITHRNLPLFNTLIGLLNKFSNHLPIFMLTRYFGLSAASYYGISHRIVNMPMGLFGQAIGQVFYQRATESYNRKESIYTLVRQMYINLFRIALIPYAGLAVFAPFLFKYVLGAEWEISGYFTRILIPWLFIMFLNSPLTYVITILRKQVNMVFYDVFLLTFRFLALYAGFKLFNDIFITLGLYSVVGFVFNLILMFYILYISKRIFV